MFVHVDMFIEQRIVNKNLVEIRKELNKKLRERVQMHHIIFASKCNNYKIVSSYIEIKNRYFKTSNLWYQQKLQPGKKHRFFNKLKIKLFKI